jgi:Hydrazine synthase alpha subunit middle domain
LDEEHTQFTILTPEVPSGSAPSPAGRYREPSVLPDGRILTSWADGPVNDLNELAVTPPDFGIYVYDPVAHTNQLVYNDRNFWDLNALPIVQRAEPAVIGDVQHVVDATQPVLMGSITLANTSLDETVQGAQFTSPVSLGDALKEAVAVRIVEGFSSEAAKGVTMFGLTMDEGAAVLGTAPVYQDGSWLAKVPPYIMMHVQPIDKFGIAIRNQRLWIQGSPNEDRRCVGCHASRTGQGVPALGQNPTLAEQQSPTPTYTEAIDKRSEYPWADGYVKGSGVIQPILTAKCAGCHNSSTTTYYGVTRTDPVTGKVTTYEIPYLDLSDTPVTVYYDKKVAVYPASYVSLYYPATLAMMPAGLKITGKVAPEWMIPEDARNSILISKLNVRALDGTTAWPVSTNKFHPEDQGTQYALTDDERQMLIRSADLGGQFWSRQNTGFVPYSADPTAGSTYQQ